MKNKDDNKKDIDALRQDLQQSNNLFVTGYEKLRVSQDFELRKTVRAVGGKYRVIKNNVAGPNVELEDLGRVSASLLKALSLQPGQFIRT